MQRILVSLVLVASLVAFASPVEAKPAKYLAVKKLKPRHGSALVPTDTAVSIRFSRPVDLATVTAGTVFLRTLTGDAVDVSVSTERNGRTLVLTPRTRLRPGTDYEVVVGPGLASTDGLPLKRARNAIFFTDPKVSPLQLLHPDQFATLESQMSETRAGHTATLLPDGRVLLAGGLTDTSSFAVSGDLYLPSLKRFRSVGSSLRVPRTNHVAMRFRHGERDGVLLVGGSDVNGPLAASEFFDAAVSTFSEGPSLLEDRDYCAGVALQDGRVLVVGGLTFTPAGGARYRSTAEIYDPDLQGFRLTNSAPLARRAAHTATLLEDGRVFIVGGESGAIQPTAEIFDPRTESFTRLDTSPIHNRQLHSATSLGAGRILLADGGSPLLQIFDAATGSFNPAGGASSVRRAGATASLLPDGKVLIAGGVEDRGTQGKFGLDTMDLFLPSAGDFGRVSPTFVIFPEPRFGHTATTLPDGSVLFAGGFGLATAVDPNPENLRTGILFTPER